MWRKIQFLLAEDPLHDAIITERPNNWLPPFGNSKHGENKLAPGMDPLVFPYRSECRRGRWQVHRHLCPGAPRQGGVGGRETEVPGFPS